jgi:hypothetical protein
MSLAMKSECERCDVPLSLTTTEARICSYECTFCAACARDMHDTCPNCGGELMPRPRRDHKLEVPPASPVPGE